MCKVYAHILELMCRCYATTCVCASRHWRAGLFAMCRGSRIVGWSFVLYVLVWCFRAHSGADVCLEEVFVQVGVGVCVHDVLAHIHMMCYNVLAYIQ